jgi:rRNA-processing protein FCF1
MGRIVEGRHKRRSSGVFEHKAKASASSKFKRRVGQFVKGVKNAWSSHLTPAKLVARRSDRLEAGTDAVVLDTNILMHRLALAGRMAEEVTAEKVIYIPLIIFAELDRLKSRVDTKEKAQAAVKWLRTAQRTGRVVGQGSEGQRRANCYSSRGMPEGDDQILATCKHLVLKDEVKVLLVTDDINFGEMVKNERIYGLEVTDSIGMQRRMEKRACSPSPDRARRARSRSGGRGSHGLRGMMPDTPGRAACSGGRRRSRSWSHWGRIRGDYSWDSLLQQAKWERCSREDGWQQIRE